MKQKEVILFKTDRSKATTNSKFTFRAIVRYAVVAAMTSLIIYVLLMMKSSIIDLEDFKNIVSPLIAIVFIVVIGTTTIKMNQHTFNGYFWTALMASLAIGYASFVAVYVKDISIEDYKDLYVFMYYAVAIIGFRMIWQLGITFFERKTRPYVSRHMLWKAINNFILISFLGVMYLFAYYHSSIIKKDYTELDKYNKLMVFHVIGAPILLMTWIGLVILRWKLFRKKVKFEYELKNFTASLMFMLIIPLTVWYTYEFLSMPEFKYDYILLIGPIFVVLLGAFVTLNRKSRIAAPVIVSTLYAICLLIIWINKFFFELMFTQEITHQWDIAVTLISTTMIILMMLIKNNPITKTQSFAQIMFVFFVSVFILVSWILDSLPKNDIQEWLDIIEAKLGVSVDEILDTMVIFNVVGLVSTSIYSWYRVQAKINNNIARKLRRQKRSNKKDIKKEINEKGGKHA